MVKRYKFHIVVILMNLLCLNLSHAQTGGGTLGPDPAPAPAPPSAPAPAPAPAAPAPAPAATSTATVPATNGGPATNLLGAPGTVDPNTILNINKAVGGKFEEFQSICRSREFDKLKYQSRELYNAKLKNLSEQTNALIAAPNASPENFQLLNELLENQSMKDFDRLVSSLRKKKLSAADTNKLNGFAAYAKRNFREATANFLKVINDEKNQTDEFLLKTMAQLYAKESNFYEASAIYEDLNKIKKNVYLRELCEMMVLNSLNSDGESVCLTAATKFPGDPFPLIFAGITFRERENLKRARDLFRRANNIKPTEMGNVCIAEVALMENKIDEAVNYFKLSVDQSPMSARAVLGLAWAQIKALNFNEALGTFKQACRLNPLYEVEVRKAYKKLVDDNVPEADKFMRLASSCGQ